MLSVTSDRMPLTEENIMRRPLLAILTVALVLVGCTTDSAPEDTDPPDPGAIGEDPTALPDDIVLASALTAFEACDDLEAHLKDAALDVVTPWGLEGGGGWGPMPADGRAAMETEAATDDAEDAGGDTAAGSVADGAVGSNQTGTNVQEAGVDEPDRVKTDGTHLYVMTPEALRILDITGDDPVEVASLTMRDAYDAQLLLADDRLLVTSSAPQAVPFASESARSGAADRSGSIAEDGDIAFPGQGYSGTTTLTVVDIEDATDPEVLERLTVDGTTLSTRLIDGVARVVVRTPQGNLPWEFPEASGLRAERRALEANRQIIRNSDVEDWLPYAVHETADGRTDEGALLACDTVNRPATFSGLGMLSVLTVDVATGDLALDPDRNVAVLAGGDTVYASPESLYVATTRWIDWGAISSEEVRRERQSEVTTDIHRFDLGVGERAEYRASGQVPGTLLSQWAMSEHDGILRVASTSGDMWGGDVSESYVTTLAEQGDELEQLGQVDGLGLTERIYAVRFIRDVGYVVTFRQTDPLYTIDLADPSDPQMTGELKILGYSAYLHPIGDDRLIGVGQDADDQGRVKGTQLSLFDVSDPAAPTEVDKVVLADASSDAEHDHRAFMHHPASGLTVVPYTRWNYDEISGREDVDTGAIGFVVRDGAIEERGRLAHLPAWLDDLRAELKDRDPATFDQDDWRAQERVWEWGHRGRISRSMVLDDRLVTISEVGVGVHDLDSLQDVGWLSFDQ